MPSPSFERVRVRWLPLWIIASALLLLPIRAALPGLAHGRRWELLSQYTLYGALLAWILLQCANAGITLRQLIGPRPRREEWRLISLALPLIPLAIGSVWLLWLPLSFLIPDVVQRWVLRHDQPIWNPAMPVSSVFYVMVVVVLAPFVEESLFRGVLLQRWSLKWGVGRALLVSSVLFGVLHADILGHTVFAIVMGLLYVRTRGLWIPMGCHALTNALAVLGQALPWDAKDTITTVAEFRNDWYVGALALAIGVPLLYAMRSHFWPPRGWALPSLAPNSDNPIAF
jgi:membrane protease YdiL (CAAX protease family)